MYPARRAVVVAKADIPAASEGDPKTCPLGEGYLAIFEKLPSSPSSGSLRKSTEIIEFFNVRPEAIAAGQYVRVVQLVDETWVVTCGCDIGSSSSSSSSSGSLSSGGRLMCDCTGFGFEIAPALTSLDAMDAVVAAVAAGGDLFGSTGFRLFGISTCYGIDTEGFIEEIRILVHFTCCANGVGSLAHCHQIEPGPEGLPEGHDLIQNVFCSQAYGYSGDAAISYCAEVGPVTCDNFFLNALENDCAFSDPVTAVWDIPARENDLHNCCSQAEDYEEPPPEELI